MMKLYSVMMVDQTVPGESNEFEPQLVFKNTSNTYGIRYVDIALDENPKEDCKMQGSV